MRISQELAADLRYLAAELEWEEVDKAEIRQAIRENPEFFEHFWTVFAHAHRLGYRFHAENGFQKLDDFCAKNGLPDPYGRAFTGAEVDALERKA